MDVNRGLECSHSSYSGSSHPHLEFCSFQIIRNLDLVSWPSMFR